MSGDDIWNDEAVIDLVRQRVQRGADFLDEHDPGWERRVDPNVLLLDLCSRCVLGQLAGLEQGTPWDSIVEKSIGEVAMTEDCNANGAWLYLHGFDSLDGIDAEYALLTTLWRDVVRRRQDEATYRAEIAAEVKRNGG